MASAFLDGQFVPLAEARLSALDAGVQHGVGLFETMTAVAAPGRAPRLIHLPAHLRRLERSALDLGLSAALRVAPLAEAVRRTAARAAADWPDTERFRVRLTLTGGDLRLLSHAPGRPDAGARRDHQPTLLIVAQPAPAYPDEFFDQGVAVTIADWKANPLDAFQGHKTLWYWPRLAALQQAAAARAGEALVFTVSNHLAGGCVSNAILIKGREALTPIARGEEEDAAVDLEAERAGVDPDRETPPPRRGPLLRSPVLPGVTRDWALQTLASRGLRPRKRLVTIHDVLDADELLLTNSSWGVLPVVRVEERAIGAGVGPVAQDLLNAWRGTDGLPAGADDQDGDDPAGAETTA